MMPQHATDPARTATPAWHGFAVSRQRPAVGVDLAWAVAPIPAGWQVEWTGHDPPDETALTMALFGDMPGVWCLSQGEAAAGRLCIAAFDANESLCGALVIGPAPLATGREWLIARLGTPLDPAERFRLLDGRPGGALRPRGTIVCFCCDVRHEEIVAAIAGGAVTVEAVGAGTRAGSNCGSCQPNIAALLPLDENAPAP